MNTYKKDIFNTDLIQDEIIISVREIVLCYNKRTNKRNDVVIEKIYLIIWKELCDHMDSLLYEK